MCTHRWVVHCFSPLASLHNVDKKSSCARRNRSWKLVSGPICTSSVVTAKWKYFHYIYLFISTCIDAEWFGIPEDIEIRTVSKEKENSINSLSAVKVSLERICNSRIQRVTHTQQPHGARQSHSTNRTGASGSWDYWGEVGQFKSAALQAFSHRCATAHKFSSKFSQLGASHFEKFTTFQQRKEFLLPRRFVVCRENNETTQLALNQQCFGLHHFCVR